MMALYLAIVGMFLILAQLPDTVTQYAAPGFMIIAILFMELWEFLAKRVLPRRTSPNQKQAAPADAQQSVDPQSP